MAKKGRYREVEEKEEIKWFQWEFLRRNPGYRQDYDALMARFGGWFRKKGFWYDRSVPYRGKNWEFFQKVISPWFQEICRKWEIREPFPPDWTFDRSSSLREYEPRYSNRGQGFLFKVARPQAGQPLPKSPRREHRLRRYVYLPAGESPEEAAALWDLARSPVTLRKLAKAAKAARRARPIRSNTVNRHGKYTWLKFDVTRPLRQLLEQARRELSPHSPYGALIVPSYITLTHYNYSRYNLLKGVRNGQLQG